MPLAPPPERAGLRRAAMEQRADTPELSSTAPLRRTRRRHPAEVRRARADVAPFSPGGRASVQREAPGFTNNLMSPSGQRLGRRPTPMEALTPAPQGARGS